MQWSQILFSNPYICKPSRRKPFIFQTLTIGPNIPNSLKYKRSTISACNDIGIRKLEFVFTAKLLYLSVLHIIVKQTGHMQMLLTTGSFKKHETLISFFLQRLPKNKLWSGIGKDVDFWSLANSTNRRVEQYPNYHASECCSMIGWFS